MTHPALLVLEDGTTLRGTAFGAEGETFGEMVFNTGMTGYVVRELARLASSWRATGDLDAYLRAEGVTGIAVRGTRLLTRRVRERGAMRAAISTVETEPARLL